MKRTDPVFAILLLSIFMFLADLGREAYHFHIRDTYYEFPAWFPALVMGFHWLIYKASRNWLYSTGLIWMHYVMLVISYLLIVSERKLFGQHGSSYMLLLLIIGMVVFFINVVLGIIRKARVAGSKSMEQ